MADAVLLPDGTVAIVAGAGRGKADDSGVPVMWVESYDPESEMFIGMSALSVPRLYHSTALLLPDGSVLIAGSTGGRFHYTLGGGSADEFRLEVYHPPYLFRGPAPRIQLGGPRLRYGQALTLRILSGDGTQIQRVAVLRAGSTTHTNNMDQRYVGLRVLSRTSSEVRVEGPTEGTVAPPSPYLLFAIKVRGSQDVPANRIPSAGQMLLVGP
jgi:hypothetical protein